MDVLDACVAAAFDSYYQRNRMLRYFIFALSSGSFRRHLFRTANPPFFACGRLWGVHNLQLVQPDFV
jgi:hypothetical protein